MRTAADVEKIFNQCQKDLENIGVGHGKVAEFALEKLRKDDYGYTVRISGTDTFHVSISTIFLDERITLDGLRGLMYHELLHTLPGCQNHGKKWTSLAKLVHEKFPACWVEQITPEANLGIPDEVLYPKKPKYKIQCKCCSNYFYRTRWTAMLENIEEYTCRYCHGEFEIIEQF